MSFPKITATLSDADAQKAQADAKDIWDTLPFMISITGEEKKSIPRMGSGSIGWVEKALDYAQANSNLVPPYMDVNELKGELQLTKQLNPIWEAVNQLNTMLDGTYAVVGSEAYVAALSFYSSVRDAAKRDVPGAKAIYEDLQKRFPGHPKGSSPTPNQSKP